MPARSQKQQEYFGEIVSGKVPLPKGMTMTQAREFASTPRKGLPVHSSKPSAPRRSSKRGR